MNEIGENIRFYRTMRNLGQKNIAISLGKSQNWVQGIESGRIPLTDKDESLSDIAKLLEVEVSDLPREVKQSFVNCSNSGNYNTYHIANDLADIKGLMKELIQAIKE